MRSTILIVDDEPMLLDLFREALSDDYEVLVAESIDGAIELLRQQTVHVVVTDLNCGRGSGLDLLRWIRTNRPQLFTSCLLMSGDATPDMEGIDVPVICKPIDIEHLLSACKSMLNPACRF